MTKIYECLPCKGLAEKGVKGFKRVRGTRQQIRKHLVEEHLMKGNRPRNEIANQKSNSPYARPSPITKSMIAEEA